MDPSVVYQAVFITFALVGISAFYYAFKQNRTVQMRSVSRYQTLQALIARTVDEPEVVSMFQKSGLKINPIQYQLIRYALMLAAIIYLVFDYAKGGDVSRSTVFVVFLFAVSSPKMKLFKQKSPLHILMDFMRRQKASKQDIELYRAVTQLKNLAIASNKNIPNADFILHQLRKFAVVTAPVFDSTIALWNMNKKSEACRYFYESIGTPAAKQFAAILDKLDSLKPNEFLQQLLLFQQTIRSERETKVKEKTTNRGTAIYVIVAVAPLAALLNLIVVGFAIDFLYDLQNIG